MAHLLPAELLLQAGITEIGDVCHHSGHCQPHVGTFPLTVSAFLPFGILHDSQPANFVKGDGLGILAGGCGHRDQLLDKFRKFNSPLENLHAAHGSANDRIKSGEAKPFGQQQVLCADHVPDGDQWKVQVIGRPGCRIDRFWTGRSLAPAKAITADDKVLVCVDGFPGSNQVVPPPRFLVRKGVDARAMMGEDRYDQEFECSFEAAIQGAYYGNEMKEATDSGRITMVPYDPALGVVTSWDLGIGDSTAIWWSQHLSSGETRIIDYYENSGVGLDHYAKVLSEKPYHYEQHILPHDVQVKELGTGKSRLETLDALGIRNIEIAPKLAVDDGIQAARSMLARCWFDEEKCHRGIEALRQYRRGFDEKNKAWRGRPLHDWTSHGADAFRYLAVGYSPTQQWGPPIRRNLRGIA